MKMEEFVESIVRRCDMPYYDPAGSYVLWSSLYLLILGGVGFAAAHIPVYRRQLELIFKGSFSSDKAQLLSR